MPGEQQLSPSLSSSEPLLFQPWQPHAAPSPAACTQHKGGRLLHTALLTPFAQVGARPSSIFVGSLESAHPTGTRCPGVDAKSRRGKHFQLNSSLCSYRLHVLVVCILYSEIKSQKKKGTQGKEEGEDGQKSTAQSPVRLSEHSRYLLKTKQFRDRKSSTECRAAHSCDSGRLLSFHTSFAFWNDHTCQRDLQHTSSKI